MNEVELDIKEAGITFDPVEWYRTMIDSKCKHTAAFFCSRRSSKLSKPSV